MPAFVQHVVSPPDPVPAGELAISMVLPFHDEAGSVDGVVREGVAVGRALGGPFELVAVDDGSRDATGRILDGLVLEFPELVVVRHRVNRGYGAALRSGFACARHEWIFFSDGDGQFELAQLREFVEAARPGRVVLGYRAPRRDPFGRRLLGAGWRGLTRRVLGVEARDVNCGFKLFPRVIVANIPLRSEGAGISAELLVRARRAGLGQVELPVRHRSRDHGQASGARLGVVLRAFVDLAAIRLRA